MGSDSNWKDLNLPAGSKLMKVHRFTLMINGDTYDLEVDEFSDGRYAGHGEHSTDESSMLASVNGKSLKECLEKLVANVQG